jgi:hypothetical protein
MKRCRAEASACGGDAGIPALQGEEREMDSMRGDQSDCSDDSSRSSSTQDGAEHPRAAGEGWPALMAAAVLGGVVPWLIVLVANSPLLHPGARALQSGKLRAPDPLTCVPGKCWDGADKYGYPMCTEGKHVQSLVRGVPVTVNDKVCYKAMYINLDATAGVCVGILMAFAVVTARLFERIFAAVLLRDARMCVAAALVLDMPAWYYCAKVQFVYANEFMHGMWRSQVAYTYIYIYTCIHMYIYTYIQTFFSLTEMVVLCILAAHVRNSDTLRPRLLVLALSCS